MGEFPIIRIAPGLDISWDRSGEHLSWGYGNKFNTISIDKILSNAELQAIKRNSGKSAVGNFIFEGVTPGKIVNLDFKVPPFYGRGTVALTNARIITMKSDKILEHGIIIIKDGRITFVGESGKLKIPAGVKQYDLSGSTIMPGIVDLHLHSRISPDVFPQQSWMFLTSLAFGVTTARDPSLSLDSYGYKELLATGQMIGPRLYTVGRAVNPGMIANLEDYNDALSIVKKRKVFGGTVVKQYKLPLRIQRQWLLKACQSEGLNMTNEGSQNPLGVIGMIKDGNSGIEHNPIWGDIYKDVINFVAASKSILTPTLQVTYGTEEARGYFNHVYWNKANKKMIRFIDSAELKSIINSNFKNSSSPDFLIPASIDAKIYKQGGKIGMGSHGNDKGVGPHNEIWALQMGGLTNMETLKIATIHGAEAIGIQHDIGSIEIGKIADLLILNKNPLDNIQNTREIKYVMKDGVLYDGETLDQLWPRYKKCPEWKLKKTKV
jgi:hypothetical protein